MEFVSFSNQAPAEVSSVDSASSRSAGSADRGCCVGVDVPGVGYVHAEECANSAVRVRLPDGTINGLLSALGCEIRSEEAARHRVRRYRPDELPSLREDLLAQLVFAARDLAEAGLQPGQYRFCRECAWSTVVGVEGRYHARSCKTGRVFELIAALQEDSRLHPSDDPPNHTKETAGDRGGGGAGAGMRLRASEFAGVTREAADLDGATSAGIGAVAQ